MVVVKALLLNKLLSIGAGVSVLILLILIFVTESVILNGVFAMLCSDDGVVSRCKIVFRFVC